MMMQSNTRLALPGLAAALIVIGGLALGESTVGSKDRPGATDGTGRAGTTDESLQGCMQMMQGMPGGGDRRPNEQWR
jgi:hypothetical protein